MALKVGFVTKGWEARKQRIRVAQQEARVDGARALAAEYLLIVDQKIPKDTNRLANAFAEAGRDVRIAVAPVRPLVPSKGAKQLRSLLLGQLTEIEREYERLDARVRNWYEQVGRSPDKWSRRWQKRLRLLEQRYQQSKAAVEAMDRGESVAALDTGFGYLSGRPQRLYTKPKRGQGVRIYARAQIQAFGGEGRIERDATGAYIVIRNKEPHASIVMKRSGVAREASMAMRGRRGAITLSASYTRKLVKAADAVRA